MGSAVAVACAAVAISVMFSVWLYRKGTAELQALVLKSVSHDQLSAAAGLLNGRLESLESRVENACQQRQEYAEWMSEAESLNLNRRGQVLRLHRRGDSPSDIASSLRIGQGEVKLIIKIYELGRDFPETEDRT